MVLLVGDRVEPFHITFVNGELVRINVGVGAMPVLYACRCSEWFASMKLLYGAIAYLMQAHAFLYH